MMQGTSPRAIASALTTAVLTAACATEHESSEPNLKDENVSSPYQHSNTDQLVGEKPWSMAAEIVSRPATATILDLTRDVVRDGVFPVLEQHGEQWYETVPANGGSYFVRAELLESQSTEPQVRFTIASRMGEDFGRFVTSITCDRSGMIQQALVDERLQDASAATGIRYVVPSADDMSQLLHIGYYVIALSGTDGIRAVSPADIPKHEAEFRKAGY